MKSIKDYLLQNVIVICCLLGGIYLAANERDGWGWLFLFALIIVVFIRPGENHD